jgi:smad nuclear-interacting protein 1
MPPHPFPSPYIMDLESTNGTILNGDKIDTRCYVELKVGDVLKFGFSSREFVLMHEDMVSKEETKLH